MEAYARYLYTFRLLAAFKRKRKQRCCCIQALWLSSGQRWACSGDCCYWQLKDIWEKSATSLESYADALRSAFVYDGGRRGWDVRRGKKRNTIAAARTRGLAGQLIFSNASFHFLLLTTNQPDGSSTHTTLSVHQERQRRNEEKRQESSRGLKENRDRCRETGDTRTRTEKG